jgi:hypothetical protein
MGEAFLYGNGGTTLNFNVVGGTTAPAYPRENTIWVRTEHKITEYYFSTIQPENIKEGFVWFVTGTYSIFDFNALKRNGIQVCPNSAKQYVSGEWVSVTVNAWKNGEWVDLFVYLYNKGNEMHNITGGYSQLAKTGGGESSYYKLESQMRTDSIYVHAGYAGSYGAGSVGRCTANKIDLKDAHFLHVSGNCTKATNPNSIPHEGHGWVGVRITSTQSLEGSVVAENITYATGNFEFVIDVSNLTGSYYIIICASGYSGYYGEGTVSKIWYE